MKERLLIRVPVAVMIRLKSSLSNDHSDPGSTINVLLADLVDSFQWDSLPHELGFDPQAYAFQQVTLMVSPEGRAALKRYCEWNGKRMNATLAQALIERGLFEVPLNRFTP